MLAKGSEGPSEPRGSPVPSPLRSFSPFDSPVGTSHSPSGSLNRSATSSRMCSQPPARAFGGAIYMMKEDHEKERARWQSRVDEIELRLAESETLNSDMGQIKAELNKKIVELEKNQKPLIDQNRKLADRNKNLQSDVKKLEQKLCHVQDDFLSLKDSHERLWKENGSLKEKRTFPEKLEELDRYRNQVLEYSKCITALRQSGLEKDRRYDLLVQKFKRLKKCIRKGSDDDDNKSTVGSTCSDESSISLDTITEDLEESVNREIDANYEALYKENEDLQRALAQLKLSTAFSDDAMLRDQLAFAHSTIAQQQILINNQNERVSLAEQLHARIASQQETIRALEANVERLGTELAAAREEKELIEFEMIEKEEEREQLQLSLSFSQEKKDKGCETEEAFDEHDEPSVSAVRNLNTQEARTLKNKLIELRKARNLRLCERQIIADTSGYVNALENAMAEAAKTGTSQTVEWAQREEEYVDSINKLQNEVQVIQDKAELVSTLEKQLTEMKQATLELERGKQNLIDEVNRLSKEMGKLRFLLQTKEETAKKEQAKADELQKTLTALTSNRSIELAFLEEGGQRHIDLIKQKEAEMCEMLDRVKQMDKERAQLCNELQEVKAEFQKFRDEQRPSIRTELERRFEETKYKLNVALEKVHEYEVFIDAAKKRDDNTGLADVLQEELLEIKEYNEHLERQFQAQTDIIEALKQRIIQNRIFADFLNKSCEYAREIDDRLDDFEAKHNDKDTLKMTGNLRRILKAVKKEQSRADPRPLEISTGHAKVRAFNSADSSGCLSNSSEGITSPEERNTDDEWERRDRAVAGVQNGSDFASERSNSA